METNKTQSLPVLPNHLDVAFPDIQFTILASNPYDVHLFSQLKGGDDFVMALANADNVYGDFQDIVLPGVRQVGTICRILSVEADPKGIKVVALGKQIVDLDHFEINPTMGLVLANAHNRSTFNRDENDVFAALGEFVRQYQQVTTRYPQFPSCPDFTQTVVDPFMIPYHVAAFLNSPVSIKQAVLEERDPVRKLNLLTNDLERFNLDSKIEYEIQKQVSQAIDKNQREYVLREKMKVVKNQLKDFQKGGSGIAMIAATIRSRGQVHQALGRAS